MDNENNAFPQGFTFRPPGEAFEDAIRAGILSRLPQSENYAGNWMYMHTEPIRGDAFKNIMRRNYIFNPPKK